MAPEPLDPAPGAPQAGPVPPTSAHRPSPADQREVSARRATAARLLLAIVLVCWAGVLALGTPGVGTTWMVFAVMVLCGLAAAGCAALARRWVLAVTSMVVAVVSVPSLLMVATALYGP